MHQARRGGRGRPEKESAGEYPGDGPTVHQPACPGVQTRVGPEKRGEQNAQLRGGNAKLVFQHGSGDGEIPAIHVIDKDRKCEQEENQQERARNGLTPRRRGGWHEEVASSYPAGETFCNFSWGSGGAKMRPLFVYRLLTTGSPPPLRSSAFPGVPQFTKIQPVSDR